MSDELIPFGKYKGKPVFALADDKSYAEWLVAQPWFKEKHLNIYNVVINNFRPNDDSPEHNAMQIKFLDQTYALKLAYFIEPKIFDLSSKDFNDAIVSAFDRRTMYLEKIKDDLSAANLKLLYVTEPTFEQGYDVAYSVRYGISVGLNHETSRDITEIFSCNKYNYMKIQIEIKPTIGDDFPSVLRQMKASMPVKYDYEDSRDVKCLLVGTYTGVGATKEQFVQFFQSQKYRVIFASEIDQVILPEYETQFKFSDLDRLVIKPKPTSPTVTSILFGNS